MSEIFKSAEEVSSLIKNKDFMQSLRNDFKSFIKDLLKQSMIVNDLASKKINFKVSDIDHLIINSSDEKLDECLILLFDLYLTGFIDEIIYSTLGKQLTHRIYSSNPDINLFKMFVNIYTENISQFMSGISQLFDTRISLYYMQKDGFNFIDYMDSLTKESFGLMSFNDLKILLKFLHDKYSEQPSYNNLIRFINRLSNELLQINANFVIYPFLQLLKVCGADIVVGVINENKLLERSINENVNGLVKILEFRVDSELVRTGSLLDDALRN